MNFGLTEEQELLLESVDEFIETSGFDDEYFAKCWNEGRVPVEYNKATLDAGFGSLGLPEEYGGTPVDLVTLVLVAERFQRRGFDCGMLNNSLQVDDMDAFGSEEQKKAVYDYLMETGSAAFCVGITEPQAGSDNNMMTSSAHHENGNVILNGHKSMITNAFESPYILFMAREADIENNPISMYLVPRDTPGITMHHMHKIGYKMGSLAEIYFEDVTLPDSALVGKMGNGFFQLMKNFEIERLILAAQCLGMAECAFDEAAKYATQRVAFGTQIGKMQLIQEKLTDCYIKILNMRNLIYYTAWEKDNGISIRVDCNAAKLYAAQAGFEVVDDCMQIMGGIGYTEDCRISRIWRDIRQNRIGGGTDEIMIYNTGRGIFKEYASK